MLPLAVIWRQNNADKVTLEHTIYYAHIILCHITADPEIKTYWHKNLSTTAVTNFNYDGKNWEQPKCLLINS